MREQEQGRAPDVRRSIYYVQLCYRQSQRPIGIRCALPFLGKPTVDDLGLPNRMAFRKATQSIPKEEMFVDHAHTPSLDERLGIQFPSPQRLLSWPA